MNRQDKINKKQSEGEITEWVMCLIERQSSDDASSKARRLNDIADNHTSTATDIELNFNSSLQNRKHTKRTLE